MDVLEQHVDGFAHGVMDAGIGNVDHDTREYVFTIRDMPKPSLEIAVTAGDIAHNLRSALDHLAYQLVQHPRTVPLGVKKKPREERWFPIGPLDPTKYDDSGLEGADPAARTAIKELQPFRNKTHPIWLLNEINRRDKHRLLVFSEPWITDVAVNEDLFEDGTLITREPGELVGSAEIVRGRIKADIDLITYAAMNMNLVVKIGLPVMKPVKADWEIVKLSLLMIQKTAEIIYAVTEYVETGPLET
jgi:hypothetical protein